MSFRGKTVPLKTLHNGELIPLITWAVIDPVMRAVMIPVTISCLLVLFMLLSVSGSD